MKVVKRRKDGVVQRYSSSAPKFTIVFDDGKPSEKTVIGLPALKKELQAFYIRKRDDDYQADVYVFNEREEDITDSEEVYKIISEILKKEERW